MSSEIVMEYYQRLFALQADSSSVDLMHRIKFVVAENSTVFPNWFSLSMKLCYSPIAISTILSLTKGKPAYIVGGIGASKEDTKLAYALNLPLICGDITHAQTLRTRQRCRELCSELSIPIIDGEMHIHNEEQLVHAIARLIVRNVHTHEFVVKLNSEVNSRGIAILNLESIKYLRKLRKLTLADPTFELSPKRIAKIVDIIRTVRSVSACFMHSNVCRYCLGSWSQ